ncbi:MAG: SagB family peptide dehydrogenase [Luteitalea sp.]
MTADLGGLRTLVRRAPHVLSLWRGSGRVVQSARRTDGTPATDLVLEVLDGLGDWRSVDQVARVLDTPRPAVEVLLTGLLALDLIEISASAPATDDQSRHAPALAVCGGEDAWRVWSPVARLFHLATRDVTFAGAARPGPATADTAAAVTPAPVASAPSPTLPDPGGAEVALAAPVLPRTLREALRLRRTHRQFAPGGVPLQDLATLLGVTFGVQAWARIRDHAPLPLKTSPSGGARHSLEAYVWARQVDDLAPGLYHYRPDRHVLSRLDGRHGPDAVTAWLPSQDGYQNAPVIVAMVSVLARVSWRYRSARAYRVILIEAGHLAQTFCLCAAALDLAPFCTAALADSVIEQGLGLDGHAQPVCYVVGAGRPMGGPWRPHADRDAPSVETTLLGEALSRE